MRSGDALSSSLKSQLTNTHQSFSCQCCSCRALRLVPSVHPNIPRYVQGEISQKTGVFEIWVVS